MPLLVLLVVVLLVVVLLVALLEAESFPLLVVALLEAESFPLLVHCVIKFEEEFLLLSLANPLCNLFMVTPMFGSTSCVVIPMLSAWVANIFKSSKKTHLERNGMLVSLPMVVRCLILLAL